MGVEPEGQIKSVKCPVSLGGPVGKKRPQGWAVWVGVHSKVSKLIKAHSGMNVAETGFESSGTGETGRLVNKSFSTSPTLREDLLSHSK